MLDLLSRMNDKDKQQVCNDISHQSVGMLIVKITMVGVFQESAHSL